MYAQPAVEVDLPNRTTPGDTPPVTAQETAPAKAEGAGAAAQSPFDALKRLDELPPLANLPALEQEAANPLAAPQADTLEQLDRENQKLIRQVLHGLGNLPAGSRVRLNRFLLDSLESPLGAYWRNQLSSALSSAPDRSFLVINEPEAQSDYTLTGEFMRIGPVLRIYTRLTKLTDSSLAAAWYLDIPLTPFVENLLPRPAGAAAQAGTGEVRPDSYEPDSRSSPVRVQIGGAALSRTIHQGDEDWFRIQSESAGTLILETTGSMDTYMELYDGGADSGNRLTSNDDGGANGNARIEYMAEAGKPYTAKVRGLGNETGAYGFTAAFTPMPVDADEPNEAREQATEIQLNTGREASFHTASDTDWYKAAIPEGGGHLLVYTEGRMDTRITVYNGEGAVMFDDDDSGTRLNAKISAPVSGGVLYIKVVELDGQRGAYTLHTALRAPGRIDQYEDDNTIENAKPLEIGGRQQRTFTTAADIDWVKLTVAERGVYEIRAVSAERSLDTYLELIDEHEAYIAEDDDGGENFDACLRTALEPGVYFIMVRTLDDDPLDNNSYTLSIAPVNAE
jgi:hypothetical protein